MPCQDYGSNSWSDPKDSQEYARLKERADMLARIACNAMRELERQETQDFILLQNEELRAWWEQHKIDDAKAEADRIERARREKEKKAEQAIKEEMKRQALAKLSVEERELLGLNKKRK
jgi:uncharacterized membrane protein YkoI